MVATWELYPKKYDDLIDQLLFNRGVVDEAEKKRFLKPDFNLDLFDPYLLKNMDKVVKRIKAAKESSEIIAVYSDYDADGIPGAALMYRALKKIGFEPLVYIPNRESGYGLSKEGIDYLISQGCSLILTIDLGIRNFAEAEYCKDNGIDLIISDHHLPDDKYPDALYIINPKQTGDKYPFKELCGCGVAYKIIQALSKEYKEIDEKFLKWNLDLVAISTISDVVPLTSENRVLAKYGIMVCQKTHNLGLQALIKISGVEPELISEYEIGFQLAPRINAPGRLAHATKSFELLISEDENEAAELAAYLNQKNEERQKEMERTKQEVILNVADKNLDQNKIIITAGDWPKGVIGPTASKIVEIYHRPAILFSASDEFMTGSARSVSGVNIVELLEKVKTLLAKYGGHKGAAGLSVAKENYEKFIHELTMISNTQISDSELIKKVYIDAEASLKDLTRKIYDQIIKLKPFGLGNYRPIFMIKNITFESHRFVGKEKNHLSAMVCQAGGNLKSIFFQFPYEKNMIKDSESYDIVFSLNLDTWNGAEKLSLNIIDIRENGKETA